MTPPISIDGTDITGATIDGTDVTEITVDGQTVFSAVPPSGIFRLDYEDDTNTSTATDTFNGHDGTISGASYDPDAFSGNFSLDFDNTSSDHIDMGDDDEFTQDQLTIVSAVKIDSVPSRQTIAAKAAGGGNREYIFQIRDNGNGVPVLYADVGDTTGNWDINYQSTVDINTNEFTLVAVVIDTANSEVRFYKNNGTNETDSESYGGGGLANTGENLILGAQTTTGSTVMDGHLDVTDMYSKALSTSELDSLFTTGTIL